MKNQISIEYMNDEKAGEDDADELEDIDGEEHEEGDGDASSSLDKNNV